MNETLQDLDEPEICSIYIPDSMVPFIHNNLA